MRRLAALGLAGLLLLPATAWAQPKGGKKPKDIDWDDALDEIGKAFSDVMGEALDDLVSSEDLPLRREDAAFAKRLSRAVNRPLRPAKPPRRGESGAGFQPVQRRLRTFLRGDPLRLLVQPVRPKPPPPKEPSDDEEQGEGEEPKVDEDAPRTELEGIYVALEGLNVEYLTARTPDEAWDYAQRRIQYPMGFVSKIDEPRFLEVRGSVLLYARGKPMQSVEATRRLREIVWGVAPGRPDLVCAFRNKRFGLKAWGRERPLIKAAYALTNPDAERPEGLKPVQVRWSGMAATLDYPNGRRSLLDLRPDDMSLAFAVSRPKALKVLQHVDKVLAGN